MTINLQFSDDDWEECGDGPAWSRLILNSRLLINGVPHHVEALAVWSDDHGVQRAIEAQRADFDNLYAGAGADGAWMTVEIRGQDYAIIITPYCEP